MKLAATAFLPDEHPSIEFHFPDSAPDLHELTLAKSTTLPTQFRVTLEDECSSE